ncbi:hypothetical protein EMIT0111MI5_11187 [Burkholderia sp. IT-111MI5]
MRAGDHSRFGFQPHDRRMTAPVFEVAVRAEHRCHIAAVAMWHESRFPIPVLSRLPFRPIPRS